MTTVEILFRYATPPSESVTLALAATKDVYGIRKLSFDRAARTLRVEYDATRLNAATVTQLVRKAGLDLDEELPLTALLTALPPALPPAPPPAPQPAPQPAPAA